MGVGDLGQGRQEGRVEDEPVDGQAGQRQQGNDRDEGGESHSCCPGMSVQLGKQTARAGRLSVCVFSVRSTSI